jgi:hypothetical protein
LAVSNKFKHLVGDLRKSWEEEEASRAKQLEERLRNHYSAVLEHMESQLQMALKLQDEADRQWMEDVEARNKQQVCECIHVVIVMFVLLYLFTFTLFPRCVDGIIRSAPCVLSKRNVGGFMRLASLTTLNALISNCQSMKVNFCR